jgi:hypothetical protein
MHVWVTTAVDIGSSKHRGSAFDGGANVPQGRCAEEATRESVDAKCRKLTAPWVRERAATVPDIELCPFFEAHEKAGPDALLPPGVYTLQVHFRPAF